MKVLHEFLRVIKEKNPIEIRKRSVAEKSDPIRGDPPIIGSNRRNVEPSHTLVVPKIFVESF